MSRYWEALYMQFGPGTELWITKLNKYSSTIRVAFIYFLFWVISKRKQLTDCIHLSSLISWKKNYDESTKV